MPTSIASQIRNEYYVGRYVSPHDMDDLMLANQNLHP